MNTDDLDTFNYLARASSAHNAIEAVGKIIDMPSVMRSLILRDHRELGVYKRSEIDFRHDVDHFLHFVGVLELATQVQFFDPQKLAWKDATEATATTFRALSDESFVRYFSQIYPEELPQVFGSRLGLHPEYEFIELPPRHGPQYVFYKLLEVDRLFVCDPDMDLFLKLLDDFTISGFRFSDLLEVLSNPKDVAKLLDSESFSVAADSMIGMEKFLFFCEALVPVLRAASESPSFQASTYELYRYWFSETGSNSRVKLGEALSKIAAWEEPGRSFEEQRHSKLRKSAASLEYLWHGARLWN